MQKTVAFIVAVVMWLGYAALTRAIRLEAGAQMWSLGYPMLGFMYFTFWYLVILMRQDEGINIRRTSAAAFVGFLISSLFVCVMMTSWGIPLPDEYSVYFYEFVSLCFCSIGACLGTAISNGNQEHELKYQQHDPPLSQ